MTVTDLRQGTRVRVSGMGEALTGDVVAVCTPDDLTPAAAREVRAFGMTRAVGLLLFVYGEPLMLCLYEIGGEWSDGLGAGVELEIVGQHGMN